MGLQSLWGAVERLSLTLMFIMLTTAAWAHLNAFRAYFQLDGEAKAREFVVNFDGETTGISNTDRTDYTDKADAWYTVNGVRLSGKPNAKGMYIKNGKKVVVK